MRESEWTLKLVKVLRAALPNSVVLKHNDAITGGIPDLSITSFEGGPYARTTWIEVKMLGAPSVMFKPLQMEMLRRMGGWYVVWSPKLRKGWLFRADEREGWHTGQQYTFQELVDAVARFF